MIRRAFTMRLKPGAFVEYKHHHDHIWPELVAEIERAGIASITTFQRNLDLFLVSDIADETAWDKLWNSEVHKRWAAVMDPLMHLREDGIVDAGSLTEIFHLTTPANAQPAAPKSVTRNRQPAVKKTPAKKAPKKKPAPAKAAKKSVAKKKAAKKPAAKKPVAKKSKKKAKAKK